MASDALSVGLDTDFHDYYDYAFAARWQRPAHILQRRTTQGMDRREMLAYLAAQGLTTPLYGKVSQLVPHLRSVYGEDIADNLLNVVVYTYTRSHAGEGKLKLPLVEALERYPDCLASEYIPALPSGNGQSLRYLRVGFRQFWLRYTSLDDWRSNCGSVEIEFLSEEAPLDPMATRAIDSPLFAVDFIKADRLYAIDFNTAPGLRGTGIEERMKPQEVVDAIAAYFANTGQGRL